MQVKMLRLNISKNNIDFCLICNIIKQLMEYLYKENKMFDCLEVNKIDKEKILIKKENN